LQNDNKLHKLKNLVVFDEIENQEHKQLAEQAGLTIYTFNEVVEKGKEVKKSGNFSLDLPNKDDVFMLSFTSGTTGDPKGVEFTHKMYLNALSAGLKRFAVKLGD